MSYIHAHLALRASVLSALTLFTVPDELVKYLFMYFTIHLKKLR